MSHSSIKLKFFLHAIFHGQEEKRKCEKQKALKTFFFTSFLSLLLPSLSFCKKKDNGSSRLRLLLGMVMVHVHCMDGHGMAHGQWAWHGAWLKISWMGLEFGHGNRRGEGREEALSF